MMKTIQLYLFPILGIMIFLSGCATRPYGGKALPAYSETQRRDWENFTKVSFLSSGERRSASTIRSKATGNLPAEYRNHILASADFVVKLQQAEIELEREVYRITGDHQIAKMAVKALTPAAFKIIREVNREKDEGPGQRRWEDFKNTAYKNAFAVVADWFIRASQEAEAQRAFVRIYGPVLAEGNRLVFAEYELTRIMGQQPSRLLNSTRQTILDQDSRRALPGLWSEGFFSSRWYAFYSNGRLVTHATASNTREEGTWYINQGVLYLKTRFDTEAYRVLRVGRTTELVGLRSGRQIKLTAKSDNPGDLYRFVNQSRYSNYGNRGGNIQWRVRSR